MARSTPTPRLSQILRHLGVGARDIAFAQLQLKNAENSKSPRNRQSHHAKKARDARMMVASAVRNAPIRRKPNTATRTDGKKTNRNSKELKSIACSVSPG